MSKLNQELLKRALHSINNPPAERANRKFQETIDLQIGLKDYDPQRDKRFSGTVKLPNLVRPRMQIIILADQIHVDEANELGLPYVDAEKLRSFNKNRKIMKKFFKPYKILLASDTIIKQLPKLVGPVLNKLGKFPVSVTHNDDLKSKVNEAKSTIKFQLKKVLCLGVAVAHRGMTEEQQRQNITLAINFLVSLLKKNWNNVRSLHIKSTMGKSQRIYG